MRGGQSPYTGLNCSILHSILYLTLICHGHKFSLSCKTLPPSTSLPYLNKMHPELLQFLKLWCSWWGTTALSPRDSDNLSMPMFLQEFSLDSWLRSSTFIHIISHLGNENWMGPAEVHYEKKIGKIYLEILDMGTVPILYYWFRTICR